MRYFECPKCGYFETEDETPQLYHTHQGMGFAVMQVDAIRYSMCKVIKRICQEKRESQMKTCETCKGTGQVPEVPKGGDIVEVMFGRNVGLLGLVVGQQTKGLYNIGKGMGNQVMVLALKSGESYSLDPNAIKIRHGHIHIDR